ncbi:MAG: hypothetical protein ACLVGS_07665 [Streptococcus agalactiae]
MTADGPKVIEFNSRFGDPNANHLACLTSDLHKTSPIFWMAKSQPSRTDKGVTLGGCSLKRLPTRL